jgi:hypothetical protein
LDKVAKDLAGMDISEEDLARKRQELALLGG